MKSLFAGLIILSVSTFLFSCQQELDDISLNPDSGDSTLLEQYILFDTTMPAGADSIWKVHYTYDAQKRVIHFHSYDFMDFGGSALDINYYYSGADTLPYKYIAVWNEMTDIFHDTVFLWYTNGLVSKDSTIRYNMTAADFFGTDVNLFTITGNNVNIIKREYFLAGAGAPLSNEWNGTIINTYQNGNIIDQNDPGIPDFVFFDRPLYSVTYDNHINPFYRVEIPYPFLNKWIIQKNNVLVSKSWDNPTLLTTHDINTYTYNANGYPSIVREANGFDNEVLKGVFFYTR